MMARERFVASVTVTGDAPALAAPAA